LPNTKLFEVLNPAEAGRYRQFMNPAGCASMFGQGGRPQAA
jgi:hypothetical protein